MFEVYTASQNDAETQDCSLVGTEQAAAEAAVTTNGAGGSVTPATTFSWTNAAQKGEL